MVQGNRRGGHGQAVDLPKHPVIFRHVALMPDCHQGYEMPIGGAIACKSEIMGETFVIDNTSPCLHNVQYKILAFGDLLPESKGKYAFRDPTGRACIDDQNKHKIGVMQIYGNRHESRRF